MIRIEYNKYDNRRIYTTHAVVGARRHNNRSRDSRAMMRAKERWIAVKWNGVVRTKPTVTKRGRRRKKGVHKSAAVAERTYVI